MAFEERSTVSIIVWVATSVIFSVSKISKLLTAMAPSWWVRSISSTDGSTPVTASQNSGIIFSGGSQNFQWRKE